MDSTVTYKNGSLMSYNEQLCINTTEHLIPKYKKINE